MTQDNRKTNWPASFQTKFIGNAIINASNCHHFSCSSYPTICDPMDCSTPDFPVHHQLMEFAQAHVHWVSDAIQPSHLLLSPSVLRPSIFPSIRVFPNESVFPIRWPKYYNFSLSISLSNEYPRMISFRKILDLVSLQSKRLSRVFSNTTIQKYQFFGTQPSLWSNCHIHTWLLEKP